MTVVERVQPASVEGAGSSDPLRLLVVEDNQVDVVIVKALLAEELRGAPLMWARTLSEARIALQGAAPSCVLLDLGLPDSDGLETLDEVIALTPDTPIVVFSGLNDDRTGLQAVMNGAQDFLVKGKTDGALLLRSIRYAIDRKHAELERRACDRRLEEALRQKNLELERAGLAKDRFLGSMSHELRTPLNAIIGFTGTLLMELPGPLNEEQARQLYTVQGSARHLLAIINDLLDLVKVESDTTDVEIGDVDGTVVVEEVIRGLEVLAREKGLACSQRVPDTTVTVRTDRRLLSQILINLLNNAVKFTERGGVRLELDQVTSNGSPVTTFRVSDTGPGIPPEGVSRLFQAFQQLQNPGGGRTARTEGTGLGLYISQRLAALLNGEITVESEPGRGSTFTLTLREGRDG